MKSTETVTGSPGETRALAARLLEELPKRKVFALYGELGSGKTCFVQGIAAALGVREPVTSPTYTIANEYAGSRRLSHLDLYRLSDPEEAIGIGIEDYMDAAGIIAIEWAERAGDLLPRDTVYVRFEPGENENSRLVVVEYL